MDKVRAFVNEIMDLYSCKDWDETIRQCFMKIGFDWIEPRKNDWDWRAVESEEFEMRSALEFLRPELNPYQLDLLEQWDGHYRKWRDEGILYERYAAANRGKWSWQHQREYAEKTLGRRIPSSHWWYWPPVEED